MTAVQDPTLSDVGRWHAHLELTVERRRGASRLTRSAHRGPLYVQKPFYPEGPDCAHIYPLHPPGGIVSGDTLEIDVAVGQGAAALFTTPGAARVYRARESLPRQCQLTRLNVAAGASLEWFPLETIVYDGADVDTRTEVQLEQGARCVLWEVSCFGLPASGEAFERGRFMQHYRVQREGVPCFVDGFALHGGNQGAMMTEAGLAGATVSGLFLAGPFASEGEQVVEQLRTLPLSQALAAQGGLSLLGDFVVGRYLGDNAEQSRKLFAAWWQCLRPALLGRAASAPRIWLT